jgi:hypothetical protein
MWTADLRGSAQRDATPGADGPGPRGAQPGAAPADRAAGHRRLVLISVGAALAVTIIGATVVGPSPGDEAPIDFLPSLAPTQRPPTPVERTTTTGQQLSATAATAASRADERARAASTTTTTAPAPTTTTSPPALPPLPPPTAARAPARATADPSLPRYVDQLLPPGMTARISGCAWQTAGGGRLIAVGTITNSPTTSRSWTLTMHFLQARRELARASTVVPLGAGQSRVWTITAPLPVPPADLICSLSAA